MLHSFFLDLGERGLNVFKLSLGSSWTRERRGLVVQVFTVVNMSCRHKEVGTSLCHYIQASMLLMSMGPIHPVAPIRHVLSAVFLGDNPSPG